MHRKCSAGRCHRTCRPNRFGWSFFFAVWWRCARSRLHMNSVVLVQSQGSGALVRIIRLQKFDRRVTTCSSHVHLNRLIDENTPLEQSTIETCLQKAYKYKKVAKISCDIGSRFKASWLDCVTMMSKMTIAVIVVPALCHRLDTSWFRLITNILIQSRDSCMIARWHQCGTMTSQMLARASFSAVCLTVFPFEFRPRTFTIGFYGKKSFIPELMILECSFPLSPRAYTWTAAAHCAIARSLLLTLFFCHVHDSDWLDWPTFCSLLSFTWVLPVFYRLLAAFFSCTCLFSFASLENSHHHYFKSV